MILSRVFNRFFGAAKPHIQIEPTGAKVWVNKNTRVICQGITGSQVLSTLPRELTKLNRHWPITHKWLEESTLRKPELNILVYLSSRTVLKPSRPPSAMLQSSMFLPLEPLRPSSKPSRLSSNLWLSSLTVLLPSFRYPSARHD